MAVVPATFGLPGDAFVFPEDLRAARMRHVGAEVTVAMLETQVFEMSVSFHPWLWLAGPLLGAAIIFVVGMVGTRSLISSPPIRVLRGLN